MLLLGISLTFTLFCNVYSKGDVTVGTTSGLVEGFHTLSPSGHYVKSFLGIPYAEPPTGNLKFKAPVAIKPWSETFKAHRFSKSCIQGINPEFRTKEKDEWWSPKDDDVSEDCLTLNIWVPNPLTERTAVMIWVHGGGFEGGTSSSYKYDGSTLAAIGNVIVVSFNYRVNVFGFLYLDSEEAPGNMGIKDQAMAMKWVKENIFQFGGDPDRITIFGESAGGTSVNFHMFIPKNRGLFQRVIIQSGTSNATWATKEKTAAKTFNNELANKVGCGENPDNAKETVECLRNLNIDTLINATFQTNYPNTPTKWAPLLDDNVKTDEADSNVDVMIGITTEEGALFTLLLKVLNQSNDFVIDRKTMLQTIKNNLYTDNNIAAELVQHFYTNWEDPDDPIKIRSELIKFFTDTLFLCDTNAMSDFLAKNGNKVFRYQFSHNPSDSELPLWSGASHADDISFFFGLPFDHNRKFTGQERYLSLKMIEYTTNFAKYGNPNGFYRNGEEWPLYSLKKRAHINLGIPLRKAFGPDLRLKTCALYSSLLPKLLSAM